MARTRGRIVRSKDLSIDQRDRWRSICFGKTVAIFYLSTPTSPSSGFPVLFHISRLWILRCTSTFSSFFSPRARLSRYKFAMRKSLCNRVNSYALLNLFVEFQNRSLRTENFNPDTFPLDWIYSKNKSCSATLWNVVNREIKMKCKRCG